MKQHAFNWLSYSLLILLVLSCKKKQKGVLDDFPSGRFDFVSTWEHNGVHDTILGEVSGPYLQSMVYHFRVRQHVPSMNSWKEIELGKYSGILNGGFLVSRASNLNSKVIYEEHDFDHMLVYLMSGDTLKGTCRLTRKNE